MMQVEKEYAQALFLLSRDMNMEPFLEPLQLLCSLTEEMPEYLELLSSPAVSMAEKRELIEEAFGSMPQELVSFLQILCENDRIRLLPAIAKEYEALVREVTGRAVATISSAIPLSEEQQNAIVAKLEAQTKKSLEPVFRVDPQLIAGIRVEVDGQTFDRSMKRSLGEVKDVMIG